MNLLRLPSGGTKPKRTSLIMFCPKAGNVFVGFMQKGTIWALCSPMVAERHRASFDPEPGQP